MILLTGAQSTALGLVEAIESPHFEKKHLSGCVRKYSLRWTLPKEKWW